MPHGVCRHLEYDPPGVRDKPLIAVSMGDPLGIGPEVIVKAFADPALRGRARFVIFGQVRPMESACRLAGIEPFWKRVDSLESYEQSENVLLVEVSGAPTAGSDSAGPTRAGGEASFRFLAAAVDAALRPAGDPLRAGAIVTAPISKEAWALAGHGRYPGHTEYLAERFGAKRVRMMFVAPRLRVMLATGHVPLANVPGLLTPERLADTLDLAHEACRNLGVASPRIGVCGVNPHAGEAGLLGDEERRVIEPAVRAARSRGIDAIGPFPGDTIFNAALRGDYDIVVAMHHDQGLIPVKLLAFDQAVNVTAGLPAARTSPDHGTAFDIAGTNVADPGSMRAAIELAVALAATAACPARLTSNRP